MQCFANFDSLSPVMMKKKLGYKSIKLMAASNLMLPDSNYLKTVFAQISIDPLSAGYVELQLIRPVGPVCLG